MIETKRALDQLHEMGSGVPGTSREDHFFADFGPKVHGDVGGTLIAEPPAIGTLPLEEDNMELANAIAAVETKPAWGASWMTQFWSSLGEKVFKVMTPVYIYGPSCVAAACICFAILLAAALVKYPELFGAVVCHC